MLSDSDLQILVHHHQGVDRINLQLGKPLTLGRGPISDHSYVGTNLSRRHAEFISQEDGVWLRDLGSTDGTHVNGHPIGSEPLLISAEDEIRLGSLVVSVRHRLETAPAQLGLSSASTFSSALRSEILRAKAFHRTFALLIFQSDEKVSDWVPRLPPLLREIDTATFRAPNAMVVLAEATAVEATRIASGLCNDTIRCGIAMYPSSSPSMEGLIQSACSAVVRAKPIEIASGTAPAPIIADGPIVRSPNMIELYRTSERVAAASIPILILGETGTGKEVLARSIHERSPRHDKPMHSINCGAIPQTLIESVLFGHEKGAFTGADRQADGIFQAANGGTILLDEIGELPLSAQVTLLRVLDNKKVQRVGSPTERPVDVRVLASTNRDLELMCRQGEFRLDLLYRINTMTLRIPPLRDRLAEVQALAHHFIQKANRDYDREVAGLLPSALSVLLHYGWPGNIREIRNVMERAVLICVTSHISVEDLPERLRADLGTPEGLEVATPVSPKRPRYPRFKEVMEVCEAAIIRSHLQDQHGNQTLTAQTLGIARRTLVYKMRSLGIRDPSPTPDAQGVLSEHTLPEDLDLPLKERLLNIEGRLIHATLARTQGNHSEAARALGLQKRTFDNKVQRMSEREG
jgi:transcriptional regulator with PAS, ATPase and Fis domain